MLTKLSWSILGLTLLGITGAYIHQAATRRPQSALPVLGQIPTFTLQDQTNKPVSLHDLKGKPWVADFIYTHCPDQCPMLSRHMEVVQGLLPKESTAQLVSITVDPARDTPEKLAAYAKRYHADPARWRFLTGSAASIQALVQDLKLTPPKGMPKDFAINHSSRMLLVDAQGQVRGYYDGADEKDIQRLVKDLSQL